MFIYNVTNCKDNLFRGLTEIKRCEILINVIKRKGGKNELQKDFGQRKKRYKF